MNILSVITHEDVAPDFGAEMWRALPAGRRTLVSEKPLHVYWESEITDTRGLLTYRTNSGTWVCVEKEGFSASGQGIRMLYPRKSGDAWELHISDFSAALILILPEGVGASKTQPAARATLKHDRVMLFFEAESGYNGKFGAVLKLVHDKDPSSLREIVANLNKAHYKSMAGSGLSPRSPIKTQIADLSEQPSSNVAQYVPISLPEAGSVFKPDRSLQAALWSTIIACVGVVMAAAALAQGWLKVFGITFGAAATFISLVWLIHIQFCPRSKEPRSGVRGGQCRERPLRKG